MKMDVVMTRKEFEGAVLAALNVYGRAEIDSIYLRADGGIECTVRTIEEPSAPVHSSRSPTDVGQTPVDLSTVLWTPDPPPFIRTVEAEPVPEARPWKEIENGWWSVQGDRNDYSSRRCACNKFGVFVAEGWVENGNLHTTEHCEGVEAEPPTVSDAAALSASSTGEHGTVESADEDGLPYPF